MSRENGVTNRQLLRSEGASIEQNNDIDNDTYTDVHEREQEQEQDHHREKTDIERQTHRQTQEYQHIHQNLNRTVRNIHDDMKEAKISESSVKLEDDVTRQVIAVSANKNPTAFFQLARKFLMTNEMCDLSALEGAIVSAVDAAHLLERSQLASIVRIHTSYVNVEPKRRNRISLKQQQQAEISTITDLVPCQAGDDVSPRLKKKDVTVMSTAAAATDTSEKKNAPSVRDNLSEEGKASIPHSNNPRKVESFTGSSGGRELRRARILITVKRTDSYKRWLDENPLHRQAIITGDANNIEPSTVNLNIAGSPNPSYCSQIPE